VIVTPSSSALAAPHAFRPILSVPATKSDVRCGHRITLGYVDDGIRPCTTRQGDVGVVSVGQSRDNVRIQRVLPLFPRAVSRKLNRHAQRIKTAQGFPMGGLVWFGYGGLPDGESTIRVCYSLCLSAYSATNSIIAAKIANPINDSIAILFSFTQNIRNHQKNDRQNNQYQYANNSYFLFNKPTQ
jgi:hypothetical protein